MLNDEFEMEAMPQLFDASGDHPFSPHIHGYYQIVWFVKGTGRHYVDFHEYPVGDNTLFFVSPGQIHWFDKGSRFEGIIVHFNETFLTDEGRNEDAFLKYNIFNAFDARPYFRVCNTCVLSLSNIVAEIRKELTQTGAFAHVESLGYLVKLFLIQVQRMGRRENHVQLQPTNNVHCTFVKFCQMLECHYRHIHAVKEYARCMNITTKTLYNNVVEVAHLTPLQMIDNRIILEAKRMLRHSSLNVKEIAYHLGFEDSSYFVKFFKKQTGCLPLEFRDKKMEDIISM